MRPFGGVPLEVDGTQVKLSDTVAFKGLMLSGVPNFAYAIGYTNSSWTLKVGLLCEHFCRLLKHMDDNGFDAVQPEFTGSQTRPLLDFAAGYVQRSIDEIPRQGVDGPWQMTMNYTLDAETLRKGPVEDPALRFEKSLVIA